MRRPVMSAPRPKLEVCRGCGEEIDPGVCWCGMQPDAHNPWYDGHSPVPMGCQCGRDRPEAALAEGRS